jgi:hypothetical protein
MKRPNVWSPGVMLRSDEKVLDPPSTIIWPGRAVDSRPKGWPFPYFA